MKKLIEFFIHNSLFGNLLSIFIVLVGIASLFTIRRDRFPNVSYDVVTVTTTFAGASPEEIETLITNPLEIEVKEIDGIKRLMSHSVEGSSVIVIWLDPNNTTEEEAKSDLRDVVERYKADLPEGAEEPRISAIESKSEPLMEIHVFGDMPPLELRKTAKLIKEGIEEIKGVARVESESLRDIEIRVETSQSRLSKYQLSLEDLVTALKKQNVSIPGGKIEPSMDPKENRGQMIVRTTGQYDGIEDVGKTVVRANDLGRAIRVSDVADISFDLADTPIRSRTNGKSSIALNILKKDRYDAIDLVNEVNEKLVTLRKGIDPGISLELVNDTSFYIKRRLSILTGNLLVGLGLVCVLLTFMLGWRLAILVSLGIPFSFFGTVIIFDVWGQSLNLISLIGLIIVSGMLVDDAIVVTDNCSRHLEEDPEGPLTAATKGASEIWLPVAASVMTTIVVFLPLMFMSGIFGKFVRQIPLGVIIALIISLCEAFFILPAHIAEWIPKRKKLSPEDKTQIQEGFWTRRVMPFYMAIIRTVIQHRYWTALGGIFFIIGTMFMGFHMRKVLFPGDDIDIFFIRTQSPVGTSLEETERYLAPIEEAVNKLPKNELINFNSVIGKHFLGGQIIRRGSEYSQTTVFLTENKNRARSGDTIINELRKSVGTPEGFKSVSFERVNPGPPVGKPIELGVRGSSYVEILEVVDKITNTLKNFPGVSDLENTYVLGKKEQRVHVQADEAAAAGISVLEVGTTVRAAYEGIIATTIRKLSEEMDLRVSLSKEERREGETLHQLKIPNRAGNLIPISQVANIHSAQGLAEYQHEDNRRQVKILGEVDTARTSATEIRTKLEKLLPEILSSHPEISVKFGGESEDTEESMVSLGRAFVFALMGVLLILVLTFKTMMQPLIIFFVTIPVGTCSALWAFKLHGMPITFLGLMGVIALAGVIVNNAIVYVDFVNRARKEGYSNYDSLIYAANYRLRPVFLTTVTTVAGLMPTSYGIGGLDPFVTYITVGLGWGLLFGSGIILVLLPAALAIHDDRNIGRAFDFILGKSNRKTEPSPQG